MLFEQLFDLSLHIRPGAFFLLPVTRPFTEKVNQFLRNGKKCIILFLIERAAVLSKPQAKRTLGKSSIFGANSSPSVIIEPIVPSGGENGKSLLFCRSQEGPSPALLSLAGTEGRTQPQHV